MRFSLAAKLTLLAAMLVLGTTMLASYLYFDSARSVVQGRERASLRDDAELQRRELLAEFDRAPAELVLVATLPAAKAIVAGGDAAADARKSLAKDADRLLSARQHYLELALVGLDGKELFRIDRLNNGLLVASPDQFQNWQQRPDFALKNGLVAPAVAFSKVREGNAKIDSIVEGAPLELVMTTPIAGPDGQSIGWVFLRLDVSRMTARLNQSPRLFGFLVNRDLVYLAHPNPSRILKPVSNPELKQAFEQLKKRTSENPSLYDIEHIETMTLPDLTVFATNWRFAAMPDAAQMNVIASEVIRPARAVRFGRLDERSLRMQLRAAQPELLDQALQTLTAKLPDISVKADPPYECKTYFARLLAVQPDSPFVIRSKDWSTPSDRPWFALALAESHEEVEHDIAADYQRSWFFSALMAAAAAAAMLLFAILVMGRLRRMTTYAEKIAAGSETELALPVPKGRDEIGTLARAFSRMVEQIQNRTRELRESEARIRTILNTAAEGIVTIDEKGRLESFNQAAERIFGYPQAEVRGQHFRKLLYRGAPDDMPALLGIASMAIGAGGTESSLMSISRVNNTTREVVGRKRTGQAFPLEMSVSEVVLGDRLVYTAIMRDITERKQAEEQIQQMTVGLEHRVQERTTQLLQANQALETARDLALEANRAKDAFLAVMSHELRTPLNAIIGYCDYWLQEAEEYDSREMLDDLRKMQVSGKHLLTLINDILDLAKIQAGKMVLEVTDFEVGPLLNELREWVDPLVRKNSNTMTLDAAADLGTVHSDRTRIRQVLLNLISNAAKFTQNGAIRLQARKQKSADGADEIVFRVADTGVGMKPEDAARLFQPFVQVDSSNTRKHEGTGLGLAICKKLCQMMGGDIEVHSELGIGTTLTVQLPVRVSTLELPGARPESSVMAEAIPGAEVGAVLVVDDDDQSRTLLAGVLGREGYRVVTARGGSEGLEAARRERPAAVILNALAPGPGGWAVLGTLKDDPTTADIPVIMATLVDGRTRGVAFGATDYVTKPIDWDRLSLILRTHRAEPGSPVLLVEDDPITRDMTARHLRAQGWEVREATDGREALARVRESKPAVILLDLMMPNMDGFEFVETLRRDPAGQSIPVVVVTAKELSETDRSRLAGTVQQVLQKGSTTPQQLLAEVRLRMQQRAAL